MVTVVPCEEIWDREEGGQIVGGWFCGVWNGDV